MTRIASLPLSATLPRSSSSAATTAALPACALRRALHSGTPNRANVVPVYGTGPPPEPPVPNAQSVDSRIAERRKKAEMLKRAQELRASTGRPSVSANDKKAGALKKRFWKDVHVKEVDGMLLSLPASYYWLATVC